MIILGIDPGTATTGYGVIKKVKNKKNNNGFLLKYLACGTIQTSPKFNSAERLKKIYRELSKLIKKYKPEILAIENIYFFRNLKTALPVSQAKGVILLAASQKNILIYEFTPLQIKSVVANYGWAEKSAVQKKTKRLLKMKVFPRSDDAADALAAAVCCAKTLKK